MNQIQNYNNLLNYLKMRLGVPLNFLELTDDDIVNYLKDHILPEFSNYVPYYMRTIVVPEGLVRFDFDDRTYVLNVPSNLQILSVGNVFYSTTNGRSDLEAELYQSTVTHSLDPRQYVYGMEYNNMIGSLGSLQTFEYLRPSQKSEFKHLIRFDKPLINNYAIVELECIHMDLLTIPSDVWMYFKKWCLKELIELIIINRSRYESMQTNIGEIRLNIQYLDQIKSTLEQEIRDWKDNFLVNKIMFEFI